MEYIYMMVFLEDLNPLRNLNSLVILFWRFYLSFLTLNLADFVELLLSNFFPRLITLHSLQ